jgi:hypothetical protein
MSNLYYVSCRQRLDDDREDNLDLLVLADTPEEAAGYWNQEYADEDNSQRMPDKVELVPDVTQLSKGAIPWWTFKTMWRKPKE